MSAITPFPLNRPRRLRQSQPVRRLFQETNLDQQTFIQPLFVCEHLDNKKNELLQNCKVQIDHLAAYCENLLKHSIHNLMLFPETPNSKKDPSGAEAINKNNIIAQSLKILSAYKDDLNILTDIALDPYTSHGHDGILNNNGDVDNDATVKMLTEQALLFASQGATALCPSDMMDGRILSIRNALEKNGFHNTLIFSYAAKFSSSLYGPFRSAVGSTFQGSKATYQIHPANANQAVDSIKSSILEGADAIIVKPGITNLDIVYRASQLGKPVFSYFVSGEYAAFEFLSKENPKIFEELFLNIKRAGSQGIITYNALDFWKNKQ